MFAVPIRTFRRKNNGAPLPGNAVGVIQRLLGLIGVNVAWVPTRACDADVHLLFKRHRKHSGRNVHSGSPCFFQISGMDADNFLRIVHHDIHDEVDAHLTRGFNHFQAHGVLIYRGEVVHKFNHAGMVFFHRFLARKTGKNRFAPAGIPCEIMGHDHAECNEKIGFLDQGIYIELIAGFKTSHERMRFGFKSIVADDVEPINDFIAV